MLKVYPNPAKEYFAIEYNLNSNGCNGSIIIRDNLGREIDEIVVSKDKYSTIIDISDYKSGIYYVSLLCRGKIIQSNKVVVGK